MNLDRLTDEQIEYFNARKDLWQFKNGFFPRRAQELAWQDTVKKFNLTEEANHGKRHN